MERETKKERTRKYSKTNLRMKIKKHYLTFLINFYNKLIFSNYSKERKLKNLTYKWTSNVSSGHIIKLKSETIQTVLSNNISSRSPGTPLDHNKKLIEKAIGQSDLLNELFQKTYGEIYTDLYLFGNIETMTEIYGDMSKVSLFRHWYQEKFENKNAGNQKYINDMLDMTLKFFEFKRKNVK